MTFPDAQDETQDLATRFMKVIETCFKHMSKQQSQPFNPIYRQLNGNQYRAMHLLLASPGMAQKELAEQLEVTPAAISTAVRQMERFGLIERKPDVQDARLMRLFLSDEAHEVMREMNTHRWRSFANLLEGLPLSDQRVVVEALERALAARQQPEDQTNHIT